MADPRAAATPSHMHQPLPTTATTTPNNTNNTHMHTHTPTGMAPDANSGRIWVQSADSERWRLLLRPQQLDQLKQVLEPRGAREGGLHAALLRVEGAVRGAMPGRPLQMPVELGECWSGWWWWWELGGDGCWAATRAASWWW